MSWPGRVQVTVLGCSAGMKAERFQTLPLTCPWPPGRWGPGKWFYALSVLAGAAGSTKIPSEISTGGVPPAPTGKRCHRGRPAGKAQPHRAPPTLLGEGKGRGNRNTSQTEVGQRCSLGEQHSKILSIAPAGMLRQPFLFLCMA